MKAYFVRFSLRQRVEHVCMLTLFSTLALTGFPQKFYDSGWAQALASALGGVVRARQIHRVAGLLFTLLVVVHLGSGLMMLLRRTSPSLTIVPTKKDFTDAVATLKFYLGVSRQHAKFDRFDYRQKFEYWGLVMGSIVMVLTGFILLFPVGVAMALPGEVIPAAKVAHSNEGLMAFLVVILWHIYNAHLNPDVFPFDTTIFTGKISRERMEHEHPLELERLESEERGDGGV